MLQPLYNLFATVFTWINGFIGNYGWSIILMTLMLRMVMFPADYKQKVSTRKQRALQPKIEALNKKYKNDQEKMAQKQMELYKQEKVSPLSGCLPALITLPIFFAFFGALRMIEGNMIAEMYQAMLLIDPADTEAMRALVTPWLWVQNIWSPDAFNLFNPGISNVIPAATEATIANFAKNSAAFAALELTVEQYNTVMEPLRNLFASTRLGWNGFYILPILAGASSLFHSKMTMKSQPAPAANSQQKNPMSGKLMQYLFPVMSVYFCAVSNAVFAIYWLTSNLIAIGSSYLFDLVLDRRDEKKSREAAEGKALESGGKQSI